MKKASGESIFNSTELNRILPSYLLNEVGEDDKDKKNSEESMMGNFSNGKNVSKSFLYINFKLHL